jgi:hypothetical protein
VIGFGDEPAYVGFPNSVQVLLEHDGQPVEDATDLAVDVSFGDATTTFDLLPEGTPGDYRAWFVPSEPGAYTFRVTGDVEGEAIDVEMTSGQDTFAEVQATADAAFPPVEVPSAQDLAGRLEAESARVDDAQAAVASAQAAVVAAEDAADSARSVALVALALGAIGIIAGIAGLVAARRRTG